jgi:hypothetical protein
MLRRVLLTLGALGLLAGFICLLWGVYVVAFYLLLEGCVLTLGIGLERWRYQTANRRRGPWQATGERFVDPTSGELVEVYYNPETGERDYRQKSNEQ